MRYLLLCLMVVVSTAAPAVAEDAASWSAWLSSEYRVTPNVTYKIADNVEQKLDVYARRNSDGPTPTVIYIHGGGWVGGTKEGSVLALAPYLEMGFSAVNVEYRLGRVARAPAAVEDCRCALRWVIANAEKYQFDTERLIVTGASAGGHLSLTTAILPASAGLDYECPGRADLKVAAVINYFGITDVNDLMAGKQNEKSYTVAWLGGQPDREAIAKRVSPIHYVRNGLPPILTVHGDADPIVPYGHAVELHKRLDGAGLENELLTIPGGKHGGFAKDEVAKINATIRAFLTKHKLMPE